jgi:hypothetical protein
MMTSDAGALANVFWRLPEGVPGLPNRVTKFASRPFRSWIIRLDDKFMPSLRNFTKAAAPPMACLEFGIALLE